MSEDIDPDKFNQLCADVSEVKRALKGSDEYSQKGALQRLEETERRSWTNKHKIDRAWYYIIGAGAAIGTIIKGIDMLV